MATTTAHRYGMSPWWRATLVWVATFFCLAVGCRAQSLAPISFEVHAVVDRPGKSTREYLDLASEAAGNEEKLLLDTTPLLDASSIRLVTLNYDAEGNPGILIHLNAAGTKKFEEITSASTGKRLAFLLGGELYTAPMVHTTVHGGQIAISGRLTGAEAANMAERINAGLPKKRD